MREALRKAGEAIKGFDQAYSDKILNMYDQLPDKGIGSAVKSAGMMFGGAVPSFERADVNSASKAAATAASYALPAMSAVSKYVAPAAGITLAGKGILDLTATFGTAADMPEQQVLTLQ